MGQDVDGKYYLNSNMTYWFEFLAKEQRPRNRLKTKIQIRV